MAALAERGKQPFGLRLAAAFGKQPDVLVHRGLGGIVERHQALLVAFAAHYEHARVALSGRQGKGDQFGDAQPSRVKHFDQAGQPGRAQPCRCRLVRLVHGRVRLPEQAIDLGDAEHLGERTAALGPFDDGGRIVGSVSLRVKKAIELADGRKPPCHRRRREAAPARANPDRRAGLRSWLGRWCAAAPRVRSRSRQGRAHRRPACSWHPRARPQAYRGTARSGFGWSSWPAGPFRRRRVRVALRTCPAESKP